MFVNRFRSAAYRCAVWAMILGAAVLLPACDITIVDPGDNANTNTNTNDNGSPGSPVPDPSVSLVVGNLTSVAVDAEIYISTNGTGITADELFVEANRYTTGIGLASSGVLEPLSEDNVDLACQEGLVIGTAGGLFLDPETGEELGAGPARILQEGLVFDCGTSVALVFRVDDGEYTVTVALE